MLFSLYLIWRGMKRDFFLRGSSYFTVTIHGALHLAARHPASKVAALGIQPLAVRRLFDGPDALQFAAG